MVVTIPVLEEITRAIGGDLVEVSVIFQRNQDALLRSEEHIPEAEFFHNMSLFLYMGGELDDWVMEKQPVWLPKPRMIETRRVAGSFTRNPFVWLAPKRARNWGDKILEALLKVVRTQEEKEDLVWKADDWKNRYQKIVDEWLATYIKTKKSFYLFSQTFAYVFHEIGIAWEGYVIPVWAGEVQEERMDEAELEIKEMGLPPVIVISPYDERKKAEELARRVNGEILVLDIFPDDWKPGATIEELIAENRRRILEMNEAPVPD